MIQWFWRQFLKKFCPYIFAISYNLPLVSEVIHLNKLESSSPNNVSFSPVVLEEKFCYFLLSTLAKRWGPSFEQTWILLTQVCFVSNLVEITPSGSEKRFFSIMYFRYFVIISSWKRASSLAKGFAHSPLSLHPWQIELDLVISQAKPTKRWNHFWPMGAFNSFMFT